MIYASIDVRVVVTVEGDRPCMLIECHPKLNRPQTTKSVGRLRSVVSKVTAFPVLRLNDMCQIASSAET
jgi:hypothetical protein